MVLYGDPGTGKTTAAASMASYGTVIYIDTEQGLKASALRQHGINLSNIEPHRNLSYLQLRDLAWELKARIEDGEPIAGVVWDSMTATVPALLSDLTVEAAAKAERRGETRPSYVAHQDDWGNAIAQIRELLRFFRDLPIHMVITAHARRSTDESGEVRMGPATSPALQNDLVAYTDVVIATHVVEVDGQLIRAGYTNPAGRYDAKDRFGVLPTRMVLPSFDRVYRYVTGDLTRDSDTIQNEIRNHTGKDNGDA
jgi:hypothetical protein